MHKDKVPGIYKIAILGLTGLVMTQIAAYVVLKGVKNLLESRKK